MIWEPWIVALVLGTFLLVLKLGLSNTMLLHVNNFFWGFSSEQIGIFMLAVFLALFPSAWLATRATGRFGKRRQHIKERPRSFVYPGCGDP